MVHLSGWYDPYALTATENYAGLARRKQGPVRLILGPWTHGDRSLSYAGDVEFGPAAPVDGNLAEDFLDLRRRWFDRWVRGVANGVEAEPAVRVFVMGGRVRAGRNAAGRIEHGGFWREAADWPLPETAWTRFHLRADRSLGPAEPEARANSLLFAADPRNPVPTRGGAVSSGEPVMRGGAYDQGTVPRPDVLTFATPPLTEPLEIAGPIELRLWVAADEAGRRYPRQADRPPSADRRRPAGVRDEPLRGGAAAALSRFVGAADATRAGHGLRGHGEPLPGRQYLRAGPSPAPRYRRQQLSAFRHQPQFRRGRGVDGGRTDCPYPHFRQSRATVAPGPAGHSPAAGIALKAPFGRRGEDEVGDAVRMGGGDAAGSGDSGYGGCSRRRATISANELERMKPAGARAARLAETVGFWCVGTETFLMGVADQGPEEGNAYWSVACLNGTSFAIQIDPLGRPVTIPCNVLADTGKGKECFKKF